MLTDPTANTAQRIAAVLVITFDTRYLSVSFSTSGRAAGIAGAAPYGPNRRAAMNIPPGQTFQETPQ